MKKFWKEKSKSEKDYINSKRSETIKSTCIYMKENNRSYPCKIELVLDRLAKGHKIVNTEKNKEKVESILGYFPDIFYS